MGCRFILDPNSPVTGVLHGVAQVFHVSICEPHGPDEDDGDQGQYLEQREEVLHRFDRLDFVTVHSSQET